ncbi:transposable element Tcb1 transposase [Trichonephila clavipes]|nr:transposable element Tcb1 transposase [Trichonephila clavipes]
MARVSQDCLRTVTTLPWPARSPDLSPIKHIWDHLGWSVGIPTSLNELEASDNEIQLTVHVLDNACSVAFSQRASSPRLIEDETFNDSDVINNLIDYMKTDQKDRIL